jgi:hypothetical protein
MQSGAWRDSIIKKNLLNSFFSKSFTRILRVAPEKTNNLARVECLPNVPGIGISSKISGTKVPNEKRSPKTR